MGAAAAGGGCAGGGEGEVRELVGDALMDRLSWFLESEEVEGTMGD